MTRSISDIHVQPLSSTAGLPFCVIEDVEEFARTLHPAASGNAGFAEVLRHNIGVSISWNSLSTDGGRAGYAEPVVHVTATTSEPVIVIHRTHAGAVRIDNHSRRTGNSVPEGMALFETDTRVDFTLNIECGPANQATTYIVGVSAFARIIGEDTAKLLYLAGDDRSSPQASNIIPVPQHAYNALQSRAPGAIPVSMRKMLAKTQMLEHICLFAVHLSGLYRGLETSPRKQQLKALYNELIAIEGKLPSLNELADRYGMSVKTLNENFKEMFGDTITSYITNRRLNEAHQILSETETPIKVIAAQLGYTHVNNFTNAFRHKFGYPPGSLRKKHA